MIKASELFKEVKILRDICSRAGEEIARLKKSISELEKREKLLTQTAVHKNESGKSYHNTR